MTTTAVKRWCATCRDDVTFEQPGCLEDHEDECPECSSWLCVRCAEAFMIDFPISAVAEASVRRGA